MASPEDKEDLCVYLSNGAQREIGCQWENPIEEMITGVEGRREVGCQSEPAERKDVAVQVDLLTQQISWTHTGSSELVCFSVRSDGKDGGALLQHCGSNRSTGPSPKPSPSNKTRDHTPKPKPKPNPSPSNRTRTRTRTVKPSVRLSPSNDTPSPLTRTRTRIVKPSVRLSPSLSPSRPRSQRAKPTASPSLSPSRPRSQRAKPTASTPQQPQRKQSRCESPDPLNQSEEEEEGEGEEPADTTDPTWNPAQGGSPPSAVALMDSVSQDASVKLERPWSTVCDVCGKVMKNKSSLQRHSFIHTGNKPFGCHLCPLRFNRRDNLQYHMIKLHPNGVAKVTKLRDVTSWLCAVCGKTFNCRSRLKTHEVIHSGVKPFHCDLCPNKGYMRQNDLDHHKKTVHANSELTLAPRSTASCSLLCHLCGREFKSRSQLSIHLQAHTGERPHLCDICGRKFTRQYQLKRHNNLVHSNPNEGDIGEENKADALVLFPCGVCGRRLKSEAMLAAHTRVHTVERPHKCSVCLRSFQTATLMKQHQIRVHLKARAQDRLAQRKKKSSAPAKSFPCHMCSKVFKFLSLLRNHALVHSDSRPYACDYCSRSFRRLSHLKRHSEVVHANGSRPPQSFVCHICGKDKKCRSQLDRHVIVHTGERPFPCELCTARFNRQGNLQQHKRRMHGVGGSVGANGDEGETVGANEEEGEKVSTNQEEDGTSAIANQEMAEEEGEAAILFDDVISYKQEETVVAITETEVAMETVVATTETVVAMDDTDNNSSCEDSNQSEAVGT